jgi:hypothetical protein
VLLVDYSFIIAYLRRPKGWKRAVALMYSIVELHAIKPLYDPFSEKFLHPKVL